MYPHMTGLIFPNFQAFSPDVQQLYDDLSYSHKSLNCSISDYDVGDEWDLFKAPEPIMEQPVITFNPQELNSELLVDVFKEYKEILESDTSPLSEVLNYKFQDESSVVKESVYSSGQISKSMSSDCLNSAGRVHGARIEPGCTEVELGMRRAFSDGDIKTLAKGSGNDTHSSLGQPQSTSDHITEDRWQKLSRYRNKRKKRNFGRKIKYACRKALADNQPRIRGRFAKTEESEIWRK
ncbi:hypothetical protein SSX86_017020 [Deinandra increscens subsp. villosa]|uniref:CCT domain-containing protein n=1 Tax=Deinandra increscens subsp. villosa TaxID=3103831 RepID=A0AAP0GY43_9ASTR